MANSQVSRGLVLGLVVAMAMTLTCLSYAETPASEGAQPDRVAQSPPNWQALEFHASELAGSMTTRIDLKRLSATDVQASLLDAAKLESPRGAANRVVEIEIDNRVQLLVGSEIETREHLWFNEDEELPLQLTRIRQGSNPSFKQYRFGSDRVYRLRKKPGNEKEAGHPPEHWSQSSESIYSLPDGECPSVLESLQLIYLLSSPQYRISEASQTLRVFSRKHVYQVKIRAAEPGVLDVDYLQVLADGEIRIREKLQTIHVVLNSGPLKGAGAAAKPFSFLGMQGEIHFLLSDPGRVPLRISGQVPGFGVIDLELKKLGGCAHQDCIRRSNEGSHEQTK